MPGPYPADAAHRLTRKSAALLGFGFPLSKEGMRLPNKIGGFKQNRGTETSQYPEERTSTDTPRVGVSERDQASDNPKTTGNVLERRALVGDSPVRVTRRIILE